MYSNPPLQTPLADSGPEPGHRDACARGARQEHVAAAAVGSDVGIEPSNLFDRVVAGGAVRGDQRRLHRCLLSDVRVPDGRRLGKRVAARDGGHVVGRSGGSDGVRVQCHVERHVFRGPGVASSERRGEMLREEIDRAVRVIPVRAHHARLEQNLVVGDVHLRQHHSVEAPFQCA